MKNYILSYIIYALLYIIYQIYEKSYYIYYMYMGKYIFAWSRTDSLWKGMQEIGNIRCIWRGELWR